MLGLVPQIQSLAQDDGMLFYAFVRDWDTAKSRKVVEFAASRREIRVITGMPILFSRLNELVVRTQRNSLLITGAGVLLLLLIIFRRLRTALVAMLPIAVTVVGINGLLYYTAFHLNILTATISSIAIGVGIDYAIHLIFSIHYHRGKGVAQYSIVAIRTTGIPILANAMGIGIGILSLLFSPLRLHVQAAAVISFAMIASSLGALILIPAFFPSGLGCRRVRDLFQIIPQFRGSDRL
jgi:predicted RND superfamily exporter protein